MVTGIANSKDFTQKVLQWAASFDVFCCLDSNKFPDKYSKFDLLIAVGVKAEITAQAGTAFEKLEEFRNKHPGWVTGFFAYDLKNEVENLTSVNTDDLHFPDLYFFAPEHLIIIKGNDAEIISNKPEQVLEAIKSKEILPDIHESQIRLKSRFSREEYIDAVIKIKEHISRGDIYVTNFCQEFYAENAVIDPLQVLRTE